VKPLKHLLSRIQLPDLSRLFGLEGLKDSMLALVGGSIVVFVLLYTIVKLFG
jgi:hypothetical protein